MKFGFCVFCMNMSASHRVHFMVSASFSVRRGFPLSPKHFDVCVLCTVFCGGSCSKQETGDLVDISIIKC